MSKIKKYYIIEKEFITESVQGKDFRIIIDLEIIPQFNESLLNDFKWEVLKALDIYLDNRKISFYDAMELVEIYNINKL